VAALTTLLQDSLRRGSKVVLKQAPQVLAHTLYKAGLMQRVDALLIVDPREGEPLSC
jgi:hypothetical protein